MNARSIALVLSFAIGMTVGPAQVLGASSVTSAEYFIDSDPGIGKGKPVAAADGAFDSAAELLKSVAINTTGLTIGPHRVFVRAQDIFGKWGSPLFVQFMVTGDVQLSEAEYFIDSDPGAGKGTATSLAEGYSMPPGQRPILSEVPTQGLVVGPHTLYVRVKDSQGLWGLVRQVPFEVVPEPAITSVEYNVSYGADPGVQWRPAVSVDGAFDNPVESFQSLEIETSDYLEMDYFVYVRARDNYGRLGEPGMIKVPLGESAVPEPALITGVTINQNQIDIRWSETGNTYQVQRTFDLLRGTWLNLGSTTTTPAIVDAVVPNTNAFYRILTLD